MRFALVVLATLSLASSASAQRTRTHSAPTVSVEDQERDARAQALYREGEAAFQGRQFVAARDFFERAYELSRRPEMLYNIALCADRQLRVGDAMRLYEEYLVATPQGVQHEAASARLRELYAQEGARVPRPVERAAVAQHCPRGAHRANGQCIRVVHRVDPWAVTGGIALLVGGYGLEVAVTALAGLSRVDEQRDSFVAWGFVPLVGPFVQFGYLSESQKSAGFYTLLSGEAIMQIGGLVYLIQALLGADVSEPAQVGWRVGPSLSPSRTGFVLDGRF
jgi:hypothetical protein